MKTIENITQENFKPFGTVIEFSPHAQKERFEVLVEEKQDPWRLAVFRVRETDCTELECHPHSMESFEPMEGCGLLLVAVPENPEDYHVFLLDKPICLHKGVWHQMVTLAPETIVKITENLQVDSEFYKLEKRVQPFVG